MIPTSRKHLHLVNWRFGLNASVSKLIHMAPASILKQKIGFIQFSSVRPSE